MPDSVTKLLRQAEDRTAQASIIAARMLDYLPDMLSNTVRMAAITHWFNIDIIAALEQLSSREAARHCHDLRKLPSVEPFSDLGYALHELTRIGILLHLVKHEYQFFIEVNERAWDFFRHSQDSQYRVEALYHLLVVSPRAGKLALRRNADIFYKEGNLSALHNINRYLDELENIGLVKNKKDLALDVGRNMVVGLKIKELLCPICKSKIEPDQDICAQCASTKTYPVSRVAEQDLTLDNEKTDFPDRYEKLSYLGAGGMGEVFKVYDKNLKQIRALKFLLPKHADDPDRLKLFYAEVGNAQNISHRRLCRVYDIGPQGGLPYYSMEYIEGQTLADCLRESGPLNSDRMLPIIEQICEGISALHQQGFLHRDLKPANILLDKKGNVHITDYGLVELKNKIANGEIVGTWPYIAPEVLRGGNASEASDIYSLGVLIYRISTGEYPFHGKTRHRLVREIERGAAPPEVRRDEFDPELSQLIMKCLQFEPENRYLSISEVTEVTHKIMGRENFKNPFIMARSVLGEEFFGRRSELKQILDFAESSQSLVIIGDRRTGKTSILREAAPVLRERSGFIVRGFFLAALSSPTQFWKDCMDRIRRDSAMTVELNEAIKRAIEEDFGIVHLSSLLGALQESGQAMTVMIDDFDQLFFHPNFDDLFFKNLRTLDDNFNVFSLILASKMSVAELKDLTPGSEQFNLQVGVRLEPFSNEVVDQLLALGVGRLDKEDMKVAKAAAGRHPLLVQSIAWCLFGEERGLERRHHALFKFYQHAAPLFDDLWSAWSGRKNKYCSLLSVFCLFEWAERFGCGPEQAGSPRIPFEFKSEMETLAVSGLLARARRRPHTHQKARFAFKDIKWVIDAEVLLWWYWEVAVAGTRPLSTYQTWLAGGGEMLLFGGEKNAILANLRADDSAWSYDVENMTRDFLNSWND